MKYREYHTSLNYSNTHHIWPTEELAPADIVADVVLLRGQRLFQCPILKNLWHTSEAKGFFLNTQRHRTADFKSRGWPPKLLDESCAGDPLLGPNGCTEWDVPSPRNFCCMTRGSALRIFCRRPSHLRSHSVQISNSLLGCSLKF